MPKDGGVFTNIVSRNWQKHSMVDDRYIYAVGNEGWVWRMQKDGGVLTKISPKDWQVQSIVANDSYTYAIVNKHGVLRMPKDGGVLIKISPEAWQMQSIVVDDGYIYAIGNVHGVWRLAANAGAWWETPRMQNPPPSPPAPKPTAGTPIQHFVSGLCVDLPGGDIANGTLLWMWGCYGGESQQWSFQNNQLM